MTNAKRGIVSPDYKVGIKLLNHTQLMNVFPNCNDVFERIELHRNWLKEHRIQLFGDQYYQYNLMYDNVISIFGKRGTGKTSVAFTLHKQIRDDPAHPYDIVLPIIIPEIIPDDGSILGWLLATLKDEISHFNPKTLYAAEKTDYNKNDFWYNCKIQKEITVFESLSDELDELTELFYSAKYNPANELSYNIAIGNSMRQSQNYYDFAQKIMLFWDHWIEAIRERNMTQGSNEDIVPLIYFIFDDVDLAPQKVDELLSVIIKYLSHPNIIVITTADEEMFLEVIEERLDRNMGRLPKEWRIFLKSGDSYKNFHNTSDDDNGEMVQKTARRYLGKVMPTSTRYYLKLFDTVEEKRSFYLDNEKDLWEGICHQIERLLRHARYKENFLTKDKIDRDYYINFLGNTSRQLGNAYIGIKDFINSLIQISTEFKGQSPSQQNKLFRQYIRSIYNSARRFLYISINSNHDLAERIENVEEFIDEMFWPEHDGWILYLNYTRLDEYLKQDLTNFPRTERVKMALQLYSLFHFTENIFLILEKCTKKGITARCRIHGISTLRDFLCEQVFFGEVKLQRNMTAVDFLSHYRLLLNRIERMMGEDINEKKLNREYFYVFSNLLQTVPEDLIEQTFRKDREWLLEISGMLSAMYGNLYLIGKRELRNCRIYDEWDALSHYQVTIRDLLKEDIYKALDKFFLLNYAKDRITRVQKEFSQLSQHNLDHKRTIFIKRISEILQKQTEESPLYDEESDEAKKTIIIPITRLVELVDTILTGNDTLPAARPIYKSNFVSTIELLPNEEAEDLKGNLRQNLNGSGMLAALKMLYESITEWDLSVKGVYISDVTSIYDMAYEYDLGTEYQKELRRLAALIEAYIPSDYEDNEAWYISEEKIYDEIKEHLDRVKYACERDHDYNNEVKLKTVKDRINQLEQGFDVAVLADDKENFQEAVFLAIRVYLAKEIQRLYLYYTVVEKYEQDYDYSSKGMEYDITPPGEKGRPTYYYQLFLKMSELINSDTKELRGEEKKIKNLISRAASRNRKEYIRSVLQEVRYESFPN